MRRALLGPFAALALAAAVPAAAELTLPRVSPNATVTQTIGLTEFKLTYSRPGVKGRAIWGALVPHGAPWRTGANEATTFTCSSDIKVEGQALPAGTYSFFTIPTADAWTVVFSKQKELWGAFEYDTKQDQLRVTVKPQAAEHTEWMALGFENLSPTGGELALRWEKVRVPVRVEVDVVSAVLANCRSAVAEAKADDWRTPYRAADFCFNYSVEGTEAAQWLQKSLKVQENYYNVSLQAKLAAKSGKKQDAVKLAEKAIALGKAAKEPVDTKATETLMADWSGKD
jgi:hypothetical protein